MRRLACCVLAGAAVASNMGVSITFVNPFDEPYDLFWINPSGGVANAMGTIGGHAEFGLHPCRPHLWLAARRPSARQSTGPAARALRMLHRTEPFFI